MDIQTISNFNVKINIFPEYEAFKFLEYLNQVNIYKNIIFFPIIIQMPRCGFDPHKGHSLKSWIQSSFWVSCDSEYSVTSVVNSRFFLLNNFLIISVEKFSETTHNISAL